MSSIVKAFVAIIRTSLGEAEVQEFFAELILENSVLKVRETSHIEFWGLDKKKVKFIFRYLIGRAMQRRRMLPVRLVFGCRRYFCTFTIGPHFLPIAVVFNDVRSIRGKACLAVFKLFFRSTMYP